MAIVPVDRWLHLEEQIMLEVGIRELRRAALAQAQRMGRLAAERPPAVVADLESLDRQVDHIGVIAELAARAGSLAESAALRSYDAVHLAAAESIADPESRGSSRRRHAEAGRPGSWPRHRRGGLSGPVAARVPVPMSVASGTGSCPGSGHRVLVTLDNPRGWSVSRPFTVPR